MEFTNTSGNQSAIDLIPTGVLLNAIMTYKGKKNSQQTDGAYGDIEFTIDAGQPFARKKIFEMVCDPDDMKNSEAWRLMGMVALTRMIEAAGFVNPEDPSSYAQVNGVSCERILTALDGKRIPIRVKIEQGENGYQDKNKVAEYLTPNKASGGYKGFAKLQLGDHNVPNGAAKPAAAGSLFGNNTAQTTAAQTIGVFGNATTPATPSALGAKTFDPNAKPDWHR